MKGFDHKAQQLNTAQTAQVQTQGEDEVKQPEEGQLEEEELKQISGGMRPYDGGLDHTGTSVKVPK